MKERPDEEIKRERQQYRQRKVLEMIAQPGGANTADMAAVFHTKTGVIIRDVIELRRKGWPIRTSSMTTARGKYVAVFELPELYSEKLKSSTHAADAGSPT